jgi:hypothetical protein
MPLTTELAQTALNRLSQRLSRESRAEVYFDRDMRGLYATDASLYEIEPIGVVVPRMFRRCGGHCENRRGRARADRPARGSH